MNGLFVVNSLGKGVSLAIRTEFVVEIVARRRFWAASYGNLQRRESASYFAEAIAIAIAMASSLAFNPTMSALSRSSLLLSVRSSNAEGPIRRPSAPVKEVSPPSLTRPSPPSPPSPPPSSSLPINTAPIARPSSSSVTIEYQRQRAKELQEYFLDRKYEKQATEGRIFGWSTKNEINNGRWAMFGVAVGLLTEYATGSDFVDQLKIIISNLGIADVE